MIDLLKLAATPIVLILFLMACGSTMIVYGRRKKRSIKPGVILSVAGVLIFYLLSIPPVSNLLAYSLESRYRMPSEDVLSNLEAIVVLGGGFLPADEFRKCAEPSAFTYIRLFNGVEVFKQSGAKILVLSGGCPWPGDMSEAEVMKGLALKLGVLPDRIITETGSRNTMEQAAEVAKLFPPDGKRRIGIVTSAIHMFRSENAFRKKYPRDAVVPIPVDYASCPSGSGPAIGNFIPSAGAFFLSSAVTHELIGMIWYKLLGAI